MGEIGACPRCGADVGFYIGGEVYSQSGKPVGVTQDFITHCLFCMAPRLDLIRHNGKIEKRPEEKE